MTNYTYISKIAKNGKSQFFRVSEDGKKKMIKREEYEANVATAQTQAVEEAAPVVETQPATEPNVAAETETIETFAEIEVVETTAVVEPEYTAEPIPARSTETVSPLDFVKAAVADIIGKYKLTFKDWTKYASVTYRSVMIIGFDFDGNKNITAVKFMGTTLETRKTVTEIKIENPADLHKVSADIIRQIEFANWWWNNPQAKSGGVAV